MNQCLCYDWASLQCIIFVPRVFSLLQNHPRYDFVEEGVAGDERQVLCLFKDAFGSENNDI